MDIYLLLVSVARIRGTAKPVALAQGLSLSYTQFVHQPVVILV